MLGWNAAADVGIVPETELAPTINRKRNTHRTTCFDGGTKTAASIISRFAGELYLQNTSDETHGQRRTDRTVPVSWFFGRPSVVNDVRLAIVLGIVPRTDVSRY